MTGAAQKRSAGSSSGSGSAGASPARKRVKQQQAITSFFTSPKAKGKASAAPATPSAGHHDGTEADMDADERLARQLQAEWNAETPSPEQPGKVSPSPSSPVASSSRLHLGQAQNASPQVGSSMDLTDAHKAAQLSRPGLSPSIAAPATNAADIDLDALDAAIEAIALGEDIFTFDPYSVDTSSWPHTVPTAKQPGPSKPLTPYALLTHAFVLVSSTKSRITITTVLTNLLRVLRAHDPEAMLPAVYLISNHIAPPYDGVELGIGGSIVNKAIQNVTGKSSRFMKNVWDRTGDPGDVAFEAKKDVKLLTKPAPITVAKLFSTLHTIARLSGAGSQAAKLSHVNKLLVASRGEETRFLARTFISHLRIQAVRTTMATSLARAFAIVDVPPGSHSQPPSESLNGSPSSSRSAKGKGLASAVAHTESPYLILPHERDGLLAHPTKTKDRQNARWIELSARMAKAERLVREVRARHPNFSSIVPALLEVGLDGLSQRVPLRIGTPLSPMLASITRSLANMHDKLGARPFVSEYKYDGQRVQIHAALLRKDAQSSLATNASEHAFATGSPEGDISLRQFLKESGRGKWIKAGADATQEVYVRLFSRHLEDQTDKYPDVLELVPLLLGLGTPSGKDAQSQRGGQVQSFIMDAEVVAIGANSDELLPFQTLASRSRKDVQLKDVKVKVGIFAFDLMYLNGESLLKTSFRRRRELLKTRFPPLSPENPLIAGFDHVKSCESVERDEVQSFFEQARAAHCEGIMVKSLDHYWEDAPSTEGFSESYPAQNGDRAGHLHKLGDIVGNDIEMDDVPDEDRPKANAASRRSTRAGDEDDLYQAGKGVNGRGKALLSTYEPDKRCESWLKVKGDYLDSQDTLDLVPIGGWHGMGRKAQWWSPVLLALYDPETATYQALCKCISGFTDAEYKRIKFEAFVENTPDCQEATSSTPPFDVEYDSALVPAFWWRPKEVWEVRCADITISPVYTAAKGYDLGIDTDRGLSIRFPRFIRRREDKGVEQATTPGRLAKMFRDQMARAPVEDGPAVVDVDDDGENEDAMDEMDDQFDMPDGLAG